MGPTVSSAAFREHGKFPVNDRRTVALPNYDDVANRNVVEINVGACVDSKSTIGSPTSRTMR